MDEAEKERRWNTAMETVNARVQAAADAPGSESANDAHGGAIVNEIDLMLAGVVCEAELREEIERMAVNVMDLLGCRHEAAGAVIGPLVTIALFAAQLGMEPIE
jgi:hypothetical protein